MIDNFLKEQIGETVFIGLKPSKTIDISLYTTKEEFDVPILLEEMVEGVKEGNFEEEINIFHILKAIAIVLGTDEEFPLKNAYLKFVEDKVQDVKKYYISLAKELLESGKIYEPCAILNFLKKYYCDEEVLQIHGYVFENLYNIKFEELKDEDKQEILIEIIKSYEEILKDDDENSLILFKLGIIYSNLKSYVKARLYFENALAAERDEDKKELLREYLREIEPHANVEAALTYISFGRYQEALNELHKVEGANYEGGLYNYYMSICHYNLGSYEEALKDVETAIEKEDLQEFESHKALILNAMGLREEAIALYEKILSKFGKEFQALYNLGVLNYQKGDYAKALELFKEANELNKTKELEEIIKNLENNL